MKSKILLLVAFASSNAFAATAMAPATPLEAVSMKLVVLSLNNRSLQYLYRDTPVAEAFFKGRAEAFAQAAEIAASYLPPVHSKITPSLTVNNEN